MTIRLISIEEVMDKVPVSRQKIYAMIGKGEFPGQRHISANRVAWLESEVDKWIEERSLSAEKR